MLKASALIYSLVIATLISMALLSVVLFQLYGNQVNQNELMRQRLASNVVSGLHLLLSDQEMISGNTTLSIDLFGVQKDSVTLWRKNWAAYEVVGCRAFSKGMRIEKSALIGSSDSTLPTLYLADKDRALAICGNTRIEGKVYLPRIGLRKAYIEGQTYQGNQLLYGTKYISKDKIPAPEEKWDQGLENLINKRYGFPVQGVNEGDLETDSLVNDFASTTIVLDVSEVDNIDGLYLDGNIVLQSSNDLVLGAHNIFRDILIIAPSVTMRHGFRGRLQVLCNEAIVIENGVILEYPSSLVLKTNGKEATSSIVIGTNTSIEGLVALIQDEEKTGQRIVVGQGSRIKGMLYSQGYLDFRGEMDGTIYCNDFLLKTPSAVYETHLLNARMRNKLPAYYGGFLPLKKGSKKVIQWLN
jgi:hypothetical protein